MEKPLIRIHNTQTNEIIDREMTDLEYKEFLEDKKQLDKLQKEYKDKIKARKSAIDKLTSLGLTEDEIAAL